MVTVQIKEKLSFEQRNLISALQLGLIDWFQYLERMKELEPIKQYIPVDLIMTHSLGEKMNKHTPGPWMVQDGQIVEQIYNGFTIAEVRKASEVSQDEANAILIAAAPDLLLACKVALTSCDPHSASYRLIVAAIEKAEGK